MLGVKRLSEGAERRVVPGEMYTGCGRRGVSGPGEGEGGTRYEKVVRRRDRKRRNKGFRVQFRGRRGPVGPIPSTGRGHERGDPRVSE